MTKTSPLSDVTEPRRPKRPLGAAGLRCLVHAGFRVLGTPLLLALVAWPQANYAVITTAEIGPGDVWRCPCARRWDVTHVWPAPREHRYRYARWVLARDCGPDLVR